MQCLHRRYGPFWVVTTLIFLNAAAGNFAQWIHEKNQFRYHFETVCFLSFRPRPFANENLILSFFPCLQITFGAATFYCYVTIVPIILWIVLRWLEMRITLLQILCLYGYAMFIYLPVAVPCLPTHVFLAWWVKLIFLLCWCRSCVSSH